MHWLARTAHGTGKVNQFFTSSPQGSAAPIGSAGRLKDKARKAAKDQPMAYEFPVRAITDFAKAVAETKDTVIPETMLDILEEVIRGRKECFQFYVEEDAKDDNEGHAYFVSILQDVHATLAARLPKKMQKSQKSNADTPENLVNLFEYLDLEEPSEADLEQANIAGPISRPKLASRPVSTMDMLAVLRATLSKQETQLYFNFTIVYLQCIKLLRRIQSFLRSEAPADYPATMERVHSGHMINIYIANLLNAADWRSKYNAPQFRQVVGILQGFLDRKSVV